MNRLALVVCLLIPYFLPAQDAEVWEKIRQSFPDAPAVYVDRAYVLTLRVEGDSLIAYTDVSEDVLHLRENTESMTPNRVYGSHFSEITGLEAKTLVWDRNRYKEMEVAGYKKNSDRDRGIFYDDSYYFTFDYPSVSIRNRTVVKYREKHRDPRFLSGFVFGSYLPQAKASYTIRATRDIELSLEVLNDPGKRVKVDKKEKGNTVAYTWTVENYPAIRHESDGPSIRYYTPHLVLYVKSFQTKTGRKNVLPNLDALYAWYWTHIENLNKEAGSDLPGIVAKLKSNSKSEAEFVRHVFYWVQDNIQYVAFEEGMRGLIPNSGAYTCEKKYGDCKDMANLIVNMLQLGGVKAYHTWIGTRDLPYRYTHLPSPIVDNHMIVTYVTPEGKYIFIDGTSKYTAMGYPSSMIQGKEALIAKGPTEFEVREVPIVPMEKNTSIDSMVIHLEGTQVTGKGRVEMQGYPKIFGDAELDQPTADGIKNKVNRIAGKGSNKFLLDTYSVSHQFDREMPTRIDYAFTIQDYAQKAGDDLFINLNLSKDYYSAFINKATRSYPKEIEYAYRETHHTVLEIPQGFTVDELPANVSNQGTFIGFEVTYTRAGNRISLLRTVYVKGLFVEPRDFDAWNSDIRKLSDVYKESIMLRKK